MMDEGVFAAEYQPPPPWSDYVLICALVTALIIVFYLHYTA